MLKSMRLTFWISFILVIITAPPVHAAPFCIQAPGLKGFCHYHDVHECRKEARRKNGICAANYQEINLPTHSPGSFCLVLSAGNPQCVYHSFAPCEREANRRNGLCITKIQSTSSLEEIRQSRLRPDIPASPRGDSQSNSLFPDPLQPPENPLFHQSLDIRLND